MFLKKNLPNFLTLMNLLSGSLAILFVFNGSLTLASWLILLAADGERRFHAGHIGRWRELGGQERLKLVQVDV